MKSGSAQAQAVVRRALVSVQNALTSSSDQPSEADHSRLPSRPQQHRPETGQQCSGQQCTTGQLARSGQKRSVHGLRMADTILVAVGASNNAAQQLWMRHQYGAELANACRTLVRGPQFIDRTSAQSCQKQGPPPGRGGTCPSRARAWPPQTGWG